MKKINFLEDYPEAKEAFKLYSERIQEYSLWIKSKYKGNYTKVKFNSIFTENEISIIIPLLIKLYEYAVLANVNGYAPIEFGNLDILSGEYQWTTEADWMARITDGYIPLVKDGTSTIDAYRRAKDTSSTGQSSMRVILSLIFQKNEMHEDHKYHAIYKDKGYIFPNTKDNDSSTIPGGSEWVIGIDPITKREVVELISGKIKSKKNEYHPATPQQKVRDLKKNINSFIEDELNKDPLALLKLAIFLKCRAGKTPSFIDLINFTRIDYCIFISRRVAVAYEVAKNVNEFFDNIETVTFDGYYENPYTLKLKTIITTTVQSFEDDSIDFDNELSKLKVRLEEIKPYVNGLIGCLVLDEAQIGGTTRKMRLFAEAVESILGIRIFMDLSGTPSKLYARKEYTHIVESDLMEENEIRNQVQKEYGWKKRSPNMWN